MTSNRGARNLVLFAAAALTGCTAVIGTRDIFLDEGQGPASPEIVGAEPDGGAREAGPVEGSDGGATCGADVKSDPKHCGRCGHDCLGATCNLGVCATVTLASGLSNPTTVFVHGDSVYTTTYGDGRVLAIPKAGGAPRELAKGQTDPWGAFVDGTTLYWANNDYPSEPPNYHGGIYKCALPKCDAPVLVAAGDHPLNPVLVDGWLYVPEENDSQVVRMRPDGTGKTKIANATAPFAVAADATHVYFTSSQPQFWRAPIAGGASEAVGPQAFYANGYVAVDDARVYWAYSEEEGKGRVFSADKKNLAAPRIEYGDAAINKDPKGVALDAEYVYWTVWGTRTSGISNADGQVLACPKKGCPASGPIVLAKELAKPYGLALDDRAVYFAEFTNVGQLTGTVRKVAKP